MANKMSDDALSDSDPMVAAFVSAMQGPAREYDDAALAFLFPRANRGAAMQRYQCHEIVKAAKVIEVDEQRDGTAVLTLDDFDSADPDGAPSRVHVPARIVAMMQQARPTPEPDLGYFVRYADGYESWSPTKAFEAGYTVLADGAEEADRGWRDWVSFVFTDNTEHFQHMPDAELRAYMVERWDAVQKGA